MLRTGTWAGRIGTLALLAVPWFLVCGCRSFPPPTAASQSPAAGEGDHWTNHSCEVATHVPKELDRFSACQKLDPVWWLGNADEPVAPDWYRPGKHCRNLLWHLRNPCHNFSCYVIGISDKSFTRVGRFPSEVFNPGGGWNWAVCRYKRLRLPFVSYNRGRFRFYSGWRAVGDFGLELKLAAKEN